MKSLWKMKLFCILVIVNKKLRKEVEYKLYEILRTKLKIPYYVRIFFGYFCIIFAFFPLILPIFPGSFIVGIFIMMTGIILLVQAHNLKHTIKLRKSIIYLFKNLHNKVVVRRKMRDIKKHVREILKG